MNIKHHLFTRLADFLSENKRENLGSTRNGLEVTGYCTRREGDMQKERGPSPYCPAQFPPVSR